LYFKLIFIDDIFLSHISTLYVLVFDRTPTYLITFNILDYYQCQRVCVT